jgi:hypothetical protein
MRRPTADLVVLKEMSRDKFFLTWKDDCAGEELEGSHEMRKKDPLAIQIWRLSSTLSTLKPILENEQMFFNLIWICNTNKHSP